jgi:hypothetical protein
MHAIQPTEKKADPPPLSFFFLFLKTIKQNKNRQDPHFYLFFKKKKKKIFFFFPKNFHLNISNGEKKVTTFSSIIKDKEYFIIFLLINFFF